MTLNIPKGQIRCKYCNRPKSSYTAVCRCKKGVKWNNPHDTRKVINVSGKPRTIIVNPTKEFLSIFKPIKEALGRAR
jgi:hypothetical protein